MATVHYEHFWFQKWPFKYLIVKIARLSSIFLIFCYIWWFFWVPQHIWHSTLWKIIKYWKKFGENKEKPSLLFCYLNGHFWNQKCSQCTVVLPSFLIYHIKYIYFLQMSVHAKVLSNRAKKLLLKKKPALCKESSKNITKFK